MAKRIFIIIIIISSVIFFFPASYKLLITKYPRIVFLLPLNAINSFRTSLENHRKEYHNLLVLATQLSLENAQLKERLGKSLFADSFDTKTLAEAGIIARDNETGVRYLLINKGTSANIKVAMPVLTPYGLVGKIIETTEISSIVETALSPKLKISGINLRSRVVGVIEYSNFSNLRFKYAFAESDLQTNDTIITSGLGGIFPRGLNVGTVINVETDPTRFFQYVEIKPMVNFNTLENVFVLTSEIILFEERAPRTIRQRQLHNLQIQTPITPRIR